MFNIIKKNKLKKLNDLIKLYNILVINNLINYNLLTYKNDSSDNNNLENIDDYIIIDFV